MSQKICCHSCFPGCCILGRSPGEGKWGRCFSLSPRLHYLVLHCVPENIMGFSSVAPPGISTLSFLCSILSPHQLWLLKYQWKERFVCPSLKLHSLTWFIKWNRRVMHPPLIEMLQTHTNECKFWRWQSVEILSTLEESPEKYNILFSAFRQSTVRTYENTVPLFLHR